MRFPLWSDKYTYICNTEENSWVKLDKREAMNVRLHKVKPLQGHLQRRKSNGKQMYIVNKKQVSFAEV